MSGRIESGERLLELCTEQELVVGNSWFNKMDAYGIDGLWRMAVGLWRINTAMENGGIDGLCVFTKTNAWKTVRCASVERIWRRMSDHFFGGSSTEIGGWLEKCLGINELNNRVKEMAYQESLHRKYDVWRGGGRECGEGVGSRVW